MKEKLEQKDYEMLANFRFHLREYSNIVEQAAYPMGLTPQRFTALLYLVSFTRDGEMTIGRLAERLMIKHHSAVGLVDRLEAEGLVQRIPSKKDQRKVCVEITSNGKELLDQLAAVHKAELQKIGPQLRQWLRELENIG